MELMEVRVKARERRNPAMYVYMRNSNKKKQLPPSSKGRKKTGGFQQQPGILKVTKGHYPGWNH